MADTRAKWDGGSMIVTETTPRDLPDVVIEEEAESSSQLLVSRLIGAGVMMVLLSITASLWGIDGAFRILFTAYTVWVGYSWWLLYIRHPSN